MNNLFQLFEQLRSQELYHVTYTKHINKIRKEGIKPMQTSNWKVASSKKRYGNGEVYAFESKKDAIRWASKMDWAFFKSMGSGNISIVKFANDDYEWQIDTNSPLEQAGATGKWLKRNESVKPEQILDIEPVTLEVIKSY